MLSALSGATSQPGGGTIRVPPWHSTEFPSTNTPVSVLYLNELYITDVSPSPTEGATDGTTDGTGVEVGAGDAVGLGVLEGASVFVGSRVGVVGTRVGTPLGTAVGA